VNSGPSPVLSFSRSNVTSHAMKPSRSEFIEIRGLRYHVRHWGRAGAPKLFMLHGWMDVSASFQFVVDSLRRDWHVIGPDWRGFGLTAPVDGDTYWFPDYTADLEALLDHYSPDDTVTLAGHSLGGNVAMTYAGVRPARVARLVNLEGFGLPATEPSQVVARYGRWLDELRTPPVMKTYGSQAAVALRMQKTNPRLSDEKAAYLSGLWSRENADGVWEVLGDARHKAATPLLYQLNETEAIWRAIMAPVLWIEADDSQALMMMGPPASARAEIDRRIGWLRQVRRTMVRDAGHMLHHDQPADVARLIEEFLPSPKA
jgi:pimeloyl-ACP methyl ester carboxylesterase